MADEIRGKTALVTGSAQGLGREIALALAAEGVHILVNCFHSPAKAEAVCGAIRDAGAWFIMAVRAPSSQACLTRLSVCLKMVASNM